MSNATASEGSEESDGRFVSEEGAASTGHAGKEFFKFIEGVRTLKLTKVPTVGHAMLREWVWPHLHIRFLGVDIEPNIV